MISTSRERRESTVIVVCFVKSRRHDVDYSGRNHEYGSHHSEGAKAEKLKKLLFRGEVREIARVAKNKAVKIIDSF